MSETFIDRDIPEGLLREAERPAADISRILEKGRRLEGLSLYDTAALLNSKDEAATGELFETAAFITRSIYGKRLVFFAPLYLSNYCVNDCIYCGFQRSNPLSRKKLSMGEIKEQVTHLINMGHKRLLLEFGEDPANNPVDYILDAIDTVYSVKSKKGEIRRVNVNIAATTTDNYRLLKEKGIGTYQLFQETYHQETFERVHSGFKADYQRQLGAMDRAMEAGIDDVGLGVLFGLHDFRFEVLALLAHANYLQKRFGVGPHTISVPRFRPAPSVTFRPEHPVSDLDFLRIIAILRIAVPYTGLIITTRESPEIRKKAFGIGITQTSAASSTSPGGFAKRGSKELEQFKLSDQRTLDEVAMTVMNQGFTPSFCTACYRKGRTGESFMELAMPGHINRFCAPNSILTLMEYTEDHASAKTRELAFASIEKSLKEIADPALRKKTREQLEKIRDGKRDIYF